MQQTESLEKIRRSDHDTLIRLESKVDTLVTDVKELKDGTTAKLIQLETRISALEKIGEQYNPRDLVPKILANDQWIHDYKLTYKIIISVAVIVSSIVGFLMAIVSQAVGLLKNT